MYSVQLEHGRMDKSVVIFSQKFQSGSVKGITRLEYHSA
jgi:hypothetical protein